MGIALRIATERDRATKRRSDEGRILECVIEIGNCVASARPRSRSREWIATKFLRARMVFRVVNVHITPPSFDQSCPIDI